MVMRIEAGGPIAPAKLNAATNASVAACDLLDGVKDGLIRDPRDCHFDAADLIASQALRHRRA